MFYKIENANYKSNIIVETFRDFLKASGFDKFEICGWILTNWITHFESVLADALKAQPMALPIKKSSSYG